MKSVVLVDDHPVIAVALRLEFRRSGQCELIAAVSRPEELSARLDGRSPDAFVLDVVFDGQIRLGVIEECRSSFANAFIVVFTSLPKRSYAHRAIEAGADAFIGKGEDLQELIACIKTGASRPAATPSPPAARAASPPSAFAHVHLTERENEIAGALSGGQSIEKIASRLGISAKTAAVHRDNIRKKLGCRSATDLMITLSRLNATA